MQLTKLASIALLLFAGLFSPALAGQYQDVISNAFPGFQILRRSEIRLDKDNLDPEIYDRVKDHPGLVAGRFNSDKLTDFAALIRGSRLIHIPENKADGVWAAEDYYEGYLAVCLGRAQGGYECTKLKTDPMRIRKPHLDFLTKISPGSEMCSILRRFQAPKPKRNLNVLEPREGPVEITFGTDAIGLFGSDSVIFVPQPRGMYLECGVGG